MAESTSNDVLLLEVMREYANFIVERESISRIQKYMEWTRREMRISAITMAKSIGRLAGLMETETSAETILQTVLDEAISESLNSPRPDIDSDAPQDEINELTVTDRGRRIALEVVGTTALQALNILRVERGESKITNPWHPLAQYGN